MPPPACLFVLSRTLQTYSMLLKRITLENIRSYPSGTVSFPEGSVLLSGDIGSGKSTILLAIDFALFGIQKDLSGASLLRHGKEQGSVELDFEVGGKEYSIKRTLKRSKDSVRQSSGYVISGSPDKGGAVRKDLTAQESKSFILELLGYPQEALKKDSALIYRYTVYTPQEAMKEIIESDVDDRLGLIRRLFGIDKYKRIAENAETIARELRGKARELLGAVADLDLKRRESDSLAKDLSAAEKALAEAKVKSALQEHAALKKKSELEELQSRIEEVQKKKQDYASLKKECDLLAEDCERAKARIAESDPKLKDLEARMEKFNLKKPAATLREIEAGIAECEKKEREAVSKISSLETEAASLSRIFDKGTCGTCGQKVADGESFKKGIDEKRAEVAKLRAGQAELRAKVEALRKEVRAAQEHESALRELSSLSERKKDLLEGKSRYESELKDKQARYKALAEKLNAVVREIKELKGETLSQELKGLQKAYEELRSVWESVRREEAGLAQRVAGLKDRAASLASEIKRKEEAKSLMESYASSDRWLREFFVNLMGTIEKHAMVSVQHQFDSLFRKWFSMLVMDDGLSARIDDRFSVIVEQDGFESDYAFMSGGERTAIALAYRLALNRVINDLIERIRTKDLLILDEPTDGFSSDQMDSVRDVLAELGTRQTIIVSHEPKIESFVDRTIRFVKENGVSRVV